MIDLAAREEGRILLRRLQSRQLTVSEFEREWPKSSRDEAVRSIGFWVWTLFSDDDEFFALDAEDPEISVVLRNSIEFLATELEFSAEPKSLVEKARSFFSSGVEWVGCELPTHQRWPFRRE